ncbi:MAG: hypothetical protein R3E48_16780 [Burkholderiaceae bacterium]
MVIDATTEPDFGGTPMIELNGVGAGASVSGLTLADGASGSTVRGLVINRFTANGLVVEGSNNLIAGNYIGTDVAGTSDAGNTAVGIRLDNPTAFGNQIGGLTAADRNVVSGNDAQGIRVSFGAHDNVVLGNYIGTDASGSFGVANSNDGIRIIDAGTESNTIGGTLAGAGNLIAYNTGRGVDVVTGSHTILGNSIHDNGTIGIDLNIDGVTANDAGDADTGPNDLQNFPVLATASSSAGDTTVTGSLNSTASTTFRIEYFSSPVADGTGYGEGATYLGFDTVTTDGAGNATINTTLVGVATTVGHVVSATATVDNGGGSYGASSEFSNTLTVTSGTSAAPTVGFGGGEITATENAAPLILDAGATVSDADSPDFDTGHLIAAISFNGQPEDRLTIVHEGTGFGQVGVSGSNLSFSGVSIGTFTGGTDGSTPLDVTFNANANASMVQAVLRRIAFQAVGEDPSSLTRTVGVTVSDGDGGTSLTPTIDIKVDGDTDVWVTTTSDTADGDTSSMDALLADRGADGRISLREAITATNNTAGANQIYFNIPDALVGGAHTIAPLAALPSITDTVVIDASTEPDFAGTAMVEIDGTSAGTPTAAFQFSDGSDGSTLRGFVVNRFSNVTRLVFIDTGADGITVAGNVLGLDVAGTTDNGNPQKGVEILSANNLIGGLTTADRNVISGILGSGILVSGAAATGNLIQGNYIGTSSDGMLDLGNASYGVLLDSSASGNTIGGAIAGAGNVISGQGSAGIMLNTGNVNNTIQGNLIGLNAAGTAAIPNNSNGIIIQSNSVGNLVGGSTALERNVISGNSGAGVRIATATTNNNVVSGNYIGTDVTGTIGIGNSSAGVTIIAASGNRIGGTGAGEGNLIRSNAIGVQITNSLAGANAVLGNSIDANSGLGIDLDVTGVTANDAGDPDTGPNELQNFPVLVSANTSGGNTTITGSLNSTASTSFRIEYFSSPVGDASGNGEGAVVLGFETVTTDGSGNATINSTLVGVSVTIGHAVTATATVDLGGGNYGSTSEFAANVTATSPNVAPAITFGEGDKAFTENASPIFVDMTATATDADSADFDTGHLIIEFTATACSKIGSRSSTKAPGAGQIGISGANVSMAAPPSGRLRWTSRSMPARRCRRSTSRHAPHRLPGRTRGSVHAHPHRALHALGRRWRHLHADQQGHHRRRRQRRVGHDNVRHRRRARWMPRWPTAGPTAGSPCARRSPRPTTRRAPTRSISTSPTRWSMEATRSSR